MSKPAHCKRCQKETALLDPMTLDIDGDGKYLDFCLKCGEELAALIRQWLREPTIKEKT